MTDLALDWIRAQGATPWVLHLSYVKPHWPYVAPAPFHAMFRTADVGPILHGPQDGTADEHPVVRAYREHDECLSFAQEAVARHVRPAYMGLIAQLDVHLGRVLDELTAMGRLRDTLIVFASDHGEFSGDRGSAKGALLRRDRPRAVHRLRSRSARRCDARHRRSRFVEGIDVVPTISTRSDPGAPHRIEGRSLCR
jgi:arylsulfatase A-like enzyme